MKKKAMRSEKFIRKASIFLLAIVCAHVSQADESSVVSVYREGEMPGATLSAADSTAYGHISLRAGLHDWKDAELVDSSYGLQMELQLALGDTPLDLVLRGFYQDTSYEDSYLIEGESGPSYYGTWLNSATVTEFRNEESTAYGGSIQLLWNFDRNGVVNPYIAIGSMYEKAETQYDFATTSAYEMRLLWLSSRWTSGYVGRVDESEDGFTYVARLGLESNLHPVYLRIEASIVGEIYDYDDGPQAELAAIAGVNITKNFRLDVAGNYLTEWEEYYLTTGVTFLY